LSAPTLGSRLGARSARALRALYVPARTRSWPEASRLFVVGDTFSWSIDDDSARLTAVAERLGYRVAPSDWAGFARRQAVFHPDHFAALRTRWLESTHRLGLSYFHGRPHTPGYPEFDDAYEMLRRYSSRIDRVQVTHSEMRELVLSAGVASERVFQIPIGVDIGRFPAGTEDDRTEARRVLDVPSAAFVIGSFQKDGVGLGEGLEAKLVKGPDVLVETLAELRASIPELFVLLTGLARGYVRGELERLGIPYRHVYLSSRGELARAYHALDAYLVTSRQEGGPKGVLEAMATAVPVVTTRVGQAPDVVAHDENGLLVDVDDSPGLATGVQRVYEDAALRSRLRAAGRRTAERYADEQLEGRWAELLDGFVRRDGTNAG
jgi:glycosyltransferase involved in cell wall biosynthesis